MMRKHHPFALIVAFTQHALQGCLTPPRPYSHMVRCLLTYLHASTPLLTDSLCRLTVLPGSPAPARQALLGQEHFRPVLFRCFLTVLFSLNA